MRARTQKVINAAGARKLARGIPDAVLVSELDAGVLVKRWRPRLGGQFVADGPSTYDRASPSTATRLR